MVKFWFIGVLLSGFICNTRVNHPDSVMVEHHHTRFEATIHTNPEIALKYLDSLKLFQNSSYPKAEFYYKYDQGYAYFVQHRLKEAEKTYTEAWKIARENKLAEATVNAHIWVANMFFFTNRWDTARRHYNQIIEEASALSYVDGIANGYYGLASVTRDNAEVLRQHLKIDSLYRKYNTISPILSNSLGAIAKIYIDAGYLDRGLEYLKKSIAVAEESNYVPGVIYSNEMYGLVEKKKGNLQKAEEYFTIALNKAEKRKDSLYYAHNLTNLSKIDIARKDYSKAEDKVNRAYGIYAGVDDQVSISNCNLLLAEIYIGQKNYSDARFYLKNAWDEPEYLDEVDFMKHYYRIAVLLEEATGNYNRAFLSNKKLDSLEALQADLENDIAFFELEREVREAEDRTAIEKLNTEKELLEQRQINQRNILLAGLGFLSFTVITLFILFRNRNRTNQKLKELDQLKSNFFANISHEFRTPLALISGPVQKKLESAKISKKDRKELEMIHRNSNRLLNLVDQLLDLSKLEHHKYKLRISNGDLSTVVRALSESFQFTFDQKDIRFKSEVAEIPDAWFDRDVVLKILSNLLANAAKYTIQRGEVLLQLNRKNGQALLTVSNKPTSVNPEKIENLFERFYQVDQHSEGVGIGLSLVKELSELHRGKIAVYQPEMDRISFQISLPIVKSAFKIEELDQSSEAALKESPNRKHRSNGQELEVEKLEYSDGSDILLLVEDNTDMRQLLRSEFENDYTIIEAADGKEGMEQAIAHVPDLIISDIMMPQTNGIQLLQNLKRDERTSHIPIILLTARSGEEDQYQGLSEGADAYITKPFNLKLLKTRVKKLLDSRKKLRERYSQEVILKPKDIAITNLDERFLERVQAILESKLTESDFSVQEFSEAVGMSRMQLHRKLKALTGLSASEFVRSQRLKLAASLLKSSSANISQIGYEVGFNDPSYFAKCFKEAYGVAPGEYSKQSSA